MEAVVIRVVSTHDVERARRSALALAADLGFGPITAECVALATTELASNLVRYTAGGTVTVDAIRGPQPGILLESHDEGPGIPDLLAARLSTAGAPPAPAPAAYPLPFEVSSVADARRLAVHVELTLAAGYADLVGAAVPARRDEAAGWLARCALQARGWGAAPQPFPGLPERVSR